MADDFCEACGYSPRDAEREADRARDAVRGEAEQAKAARNRAENRAFGLESLLREALSKNGPRAHTLECDPNSPCWMCRARALGIEEGA